MHFDTKLKMVTASLPDEDLVPGNVKENNSQVSGKQNPTSQTNELVMKIALFEEHRSNAGFLASKKALTCARETKMYDDNSIDNR